MISTVWLAVARVVSALVREDTSWLIVADHTRPGLSAARRAMGLWGGSAGSLLLFTAVITTVVAVGARSAIRGTWAATALGAPLLWAIALIEDPFERLDVPAIAGSGLSPILEHWAMLAHPPMLYLGLALALVPAIVDDQRRRRGILGALAILTVALALGGRWAWVELGWGGWWAWDPVENVALIPWLLLVGALHTPANHRSTATLLWLVWPSVFAGTAMTRTSLRTSVHAFANAEGLGWWLWPLAAASVVIVVLTSPLRSVFSNGSPNRDDTAAHRSSPQTTRILSVRRWLPATLAAVIALVVAAGTFRPLVPGDATDGTFYSRGLWPVALVAMIGLGLAPRWSRSSPAGLAADAAIGGVGMLLLAATAGWTQWWQLGWSAALGVGLAALLGDLLRSLMGSGRRVEPRQIVAHLGVLLVCAAILGDTASSSTTVGISSGESLVVNRYHLTNVDAGIASGSIDEPGPIVLAATVLVDDVALHPELVVYPERALRLPELATRSTPIEDLQLILRSVEDDGSVVVTLNVEPLSALVWTGAVLITIATAMGAITRRASRDGPSTAH